MAIRTVLPVIPEAPVPVQHGRSSFQRPDTQPGGQPAQPSAAALPDAASILPASTPLDRVVAAALARQDGLARLFAGASALAARDASLPQPLVAALARLAGTALSKPPDGAAVRTAVGAFGLFHEAIALAGRAAPDDLKTVIFDLRAALETFLATARHRPAPERPRDRPQAPRPGQLAPATPASPAGGDLDADAPALARRLIDDADAALARIALHQTSALEELLARPDGVRPAALGAEIPIVGPGGVSLAAIRVEREDEREGGHREDGGGGPVYRVEIAFAVGRLGPMQARIGLMPGRRVVAGIWCERPEAVAPVGAELAAIRAELEAAGVDVGAVDVHLGRPPAGPRPPAQPPHRVDLAV